MEITSKTDLLRENAELRANNARMREALQVAEPYCCGRAHSKVRKVLAETPATPKVIDRDPYGQLIPAHALLDELGVRRTDTDEADRCEYHLAGRIRFLVEKVQDAARGEEREACESIALEAIRYWPADMAVVCKRIAHTIRSRDNGGQ